MTACSDATSRIRLPSIRERSRLMEALLLGIYAFFVWLIFFKFKWLPWNTACDGDRDHHSDRRH